jgi:hypothetical protein
MVRCRVYGNNQKSQICLRYEPIDPSVYDALFGVLDAELLEAWIRQEPTGTWFVELGFYMKP